MKRLGCSSLIAVFALSGCRGSARLSASSSPSPVSTAHSITLKDSASSHRAKSGSLPSPEQTPDRPYLSQRPDGTYDIKDYVNVKWPEEESWGGATCKYPQPGSICDVLFQGAVYSNEGGNTIFISAFENDASTPAAVLPVSAQKGYTKINHWLHWTIGANAKTVTFQTFLKDSSGKVLAQGFPQKYPIPQGY